MNDLKALLEQQGNAFQDFVARNDDRLDQIEARINRQGLGAAASSGTKDQGEHRKAFSSFLRKGVENGLRELEIKAALSTGSDPDGGYAVPEVIDSLIDKVLRDISPVRRAANIVRVGTSGYKKLISKGGTTSGWVGETDVRPETNTPQFAEVAPPLGEIYANPAVTQRMLDDAFFNVESWISEELGEEFAEKEGNAFILGDGVNKPKGFLTYPTADTADGTRPFGTLQYLPTGVADNFPATNPGDILIDLVHSVRPVYRQGASWMMNSATLARVRKFKDGNGDYLWKAGLAEDQASTLLGYPIIEAEDMPDVAAASFPIAFGNFKRGYTISDHVAGTRVLRDPFTNKPYVHFYTTRRVGGGVINSQAIKLLKIATA